MNTNNLSDHDATRSLFNDPLEDTEIVANVWWSYVTTRSLFNDPLEDTEINHHAHAHYHAHVLCSTIR